MKPERKILVVEDEFIVAEDLKKSLERMGHCVPSIASSGQEAIEKAKEHKPDLVLMDIKLEGEMDGIMAADVISLRYKIPVIFLTAYSDDKIIQRAKMTEPFGYLMKPFKERELRINIEIALYKHEMEKRLKDRELWLSLIIKSMGDALIATDMEGKIKLINPLAQMLTGWKQEDALGKHLSEVCSIKCEGKDNLIEEPVSKVIKEGTFYGSGYDTILLSKAGNEIPVDIIGSLIKNENDDISGIVFTFYDIFERGKSEKLLKKE